MRRSSNASSITPRRRSIARRHAPTRRTPAAREVARLRAHFRAVLAELGARDVSHLDASQRGARARLLDELRGYARAGRFPKNRDFPGLMVPYFVDAEGTRCAMAHLVESTGDVGLVAAVAASQNNAFVREIESNLAFAAWLDRAGLTAAEAARIQPSYCFVNKADACICDVGAVTTVVEAKVTAVQADGSATTTIEAVHGDGSMVMVGQQALVSTRTPLKTGDTVIAGVYQGADQIRGGGFHVDGDSVTLSCINGPPLKKADAIAALLTMGDATDSGSACSSYLASVDPEWGKSQCDDSEGGCSMNMSTETSPLMLGTLLIGAVMWARRRHGQRPRGARRVKLARGNVAAWERSPDRK